MLPCSVLSAAGAREKLIFVGRQWAWHLHFSGPCSPNVYFVSGAPLIQERTSTSRELRGRYQGMMGSANKIRIQDACSMEGAASFDILAVYKPEWVNEEMRSRLQK